MSITQDVKLQIPLKKALRDKAEKRAVLEGFSSLQEAIRVFLAGYAQGKFTNTFISEKETKMTPEYEKYLLKLIEQSEKDIERNNTFTSDSVDSLIEHLNK